MPAAGAHNLSQPPWPTAELLTARLLRTMGYPVDDRGEQLALQVSRLLTDLLGRLRARAECGES